MKSSSLLWMATLALGIWPFAQAASSPQEEVRTLPDCLDIEGKAVDWKVFDNRALILYFHKTGKDYSGRGIEQLVDRLRSDASLRAKVGIAVVNVSDANPDRAINALEGSKLLHKIIADPGRVAFSKFRAVAFPTVYVLDAKRMDVHVGKGFGPSFAQNISGAVRYASGSIGEQAFQDLLNGKAIKRVPPQLAKLQRAVELAYRMAGKEETAGALKQLSMAMDKIRAAEDLQLSADSLAAMVRLNLSLAEACGGADEKEARAAFLAEVEIYMEQLSQLYPENLSSPFLRCRLHLLHGNLENAAAELKGQRARLHPEVDFLRARLLQAQGDFEGAAAAFRQQLEAVHFHRLGGD